MMSAPFLASSYNHWNAFRRVLKITLDYDEPVGQHVPSPADAGVTQREFLDNMPGIVKSLVPHEYNLVARVHFGKCGSDPLVEIV